MAIRHLRVPLVLFGLAGLLVASAGCDGGGSAAAPTKSDKSAPTTPDALTAHEVTARRVTLRWEPSADDVEVAGYVIRRNGIDLAELPARASKYAARRLKPDTEYQFTIAAVDKAGNRSRESSPVTVKTKVLLARQRLVFRPLADAYVSEARPFNTYGTISRKLRMDGVPVRRSYLRFEVSGLRGSITEATLMLYSNKGSARGFFVHPVGPEPWDETSITYSTAPDFDEKAVARSGPFPPEVWTEVSIKELVEKDGLVTIALTTDDVTLISMRSRETGRYAPRLVVNAVRPIKP